MNFAVRSGPLTNPAVDPAKKEMLPFTAETRRRSSEPELATTKSPAAFTASAEGALSVDTPRGPLTLPAVPAMPAKSAAVLTVGAARAGDAPPSQRRLAGQRAPVAFVEPAPHAKSGAAAQGAQAVELGAALKVPARQGAHASAEDAPAEAEKVPAAQGVGLMEESGQKEPGGQRTGAPEAQ